MDSSGDFLHISWVPLNRTDWATVSTVIIYVPYDLKTLSTGTAVRTACSTICCDETLPFLQTFLVRILYKIHYVQGPNLKLARIHILDYVNTVPLMGLTAFLLNFDV